MREGQARPRYVAPSVWSLDAEGVRELLGPVESQYVMVSVGESCLPASPTGDTVQDNWSFGIATNPTRVTIDVDVVFLNADCTMAMPACASQPDPMEGPLDPKLALYPPGVAPVAAPFNGHFSPQCNEAVTGDTGCLGAGRPVDGCIVCDNEPCTLPSALPNTCAALDIDLNQGTWMVGVAPQPPGNIPGVLEDQGCYVLTVTAEAGKGITPLLLVNDDSTVTFFR